ncbi:hypothetical protein Tco_0553374 [Tanacetum coccineum]
MDESTHHVPLRQKVNMVLNFQWALSGCRNIIGYTMVFRSKSRVELVCNPPWEPTPFWAPKDCLDLEQNELYPTGDGMSSLRIFGWDSGGSEYVSSCCGLSVYYRELVLLIKVYVGCESDEQVTKEMGQGFSVSSLQGVWDASSLTLGEALARESDEGIVITNLYVLLSSSNREDLLGFLGFVDETLKLNYNVYETKGFNAKETY